MKTSFMLDSKDCCFLPYFAFGLGGSVMSEVTREQYQACRHPRLDSRYGIAIFCMLLFLPLLAVALAFSIVSLFILWIIFLLWVGAEIFYHRSVDNSVLVSQYNYPRIHDLAEEVRIYLGVEKKIHIFVYEEGAFNAYMRMFRRRAIFLNSEVLESGVEDDEVRWLVGRFMGFLRVRQESGIIGRLVRMTELSGIFSLLVFPYTRAMVYTGDRLGLAAVGGNIEAAVAAMQKMLVGRSLGYSVNPVGIVEQRRQTKGSLFALFGRMSSAFPSQVSRYVDLLSFAKRYFADRFAKFEAACPGLPDEIETLSAERETSAVAAKLVAFYLGILVAVGLTGLFWVYVASELTDSTAEDETVDTIYPPTTEEALPGSMEAATDAAVDAMGDGHFIAKPVFEAAPTTDEVAAVHPSQSFAIGGTGTMECGVYANGGLHSCKAIAESPENSGFGEAAVRLADTIKLAETDGDGVSVSGGVTSIEITFTASGM
jgi:Zn-dependent protease with chaperone function